MTTFDKIHTELCEYIDAKIPEVDIIKRREIVMYAVNLFILREGDVLQERDREWKRLMKREIKRGG